MWGRLAPALRPDLFHGNRGQRDNGAEHIAKYVSTFVKPYFTKMWPMSTFENKNSKIILFVSTFID